MLFIFFGQDLNTILIKVYMHKYNRYMKPPEIFLLYFFLNR